MKKDWLVLLILIAVVKGARDEINKADSQKNDFFKEAGINLPYKTESGVVLKDGDAIIEAIEKGGILSGKDLGFIGKKYFHKSAIFCTLIFFD